MLRPNMDTTTARENFARWDAALRTGDPETVAALYEDGSTLLPTMADRTITDRVGAVTYFTFFGSFRPTAEMVEEHVVPIADGCYLHCGVYRFTLDQDGKRVPLDARFSLLWRKGADGVWKILHHHSSRVPVMP